MRRFAIDHEIALRLVREDVTVPEGHSLVGPAVLRSHALAALYAQLRAGSLTDAEGRRLLERLASLRIRLLGDRVSRSTAWRLAVDLDWEDVARAEYLAVAQLQADVLVTDDPGLRAGAEALGVVALATWADLVGS